MTKEEMKLLALIGATIADNDIDIDEYIDEDKENEDYIDEDIEEYDEDIEEYEDDDDSIFDDEDLLITTDKELDGRDTKTTRISKRLPMTNKNHPKI